MRTRPLLILAGLASLAVLACGQEDPTFRPRGGGAISRGDLAVTSSVEGAAITLDGGPTGRATPDTLREVSAGQHVIHVFLSGYEPEPAEQTVEVEAGTLHSVHFIMSLVQGAGSIAVEAPRPAAILIDGVATGLEAPATVGGIAAGEHRVTLSLPGFSPDPEELLVTVLSDQVVDAAFDLHILKMVVCEDFSNTDCLPCPGADAALRAALASLAGSNVVSFNPHVWWPGPGDPMYRFNAGANRARVGLNGIVAAPTILVDGLSVNDPADQDAIRAAVAGRLPLPAPIAIGARGELGSTTYRITVDIWGGAEPVAAGLFLFTCIVEREVVLDPPGANGQTDYHNVLRHLFPTPPAGGWGGEELGALAAGARRTFEYVYDITGLPASVDPTGFQVLAFAQEAAGARRVVQAGTSHRP